MVASARRHRLARSQCNRLLTEALEPRVLLTTWNVGDPSAAATTNGAALQNAINSAALGDTIILAAGAQFTKKVTGIVLPYKTGTGTITIETSALSSLPAAGTRIDPSYEQYMAQILAPGGNNPAMSTATGGGSNAPHNYTFIGLEFSALTAAAGTVDTDLLVLGDASSNQSTVASAPSNFIIDRCYFHAFENTPGVTLPTTSIKSAVTLICYNATVENSYITDIHELGGTKEAHGIVGGSNGIGNYTITNNFVEASTEDIFFGGAPTNIPNQNTTNITITHNLITKDPSWNPNDPSFVDYGYPKNADGGPETYWVKNLIEFKEGINVTIDQNVFQNSWINGDQRGQAIEIGSINSGATTSNPNGNTWVETGNFTITNNVIRNCAVSFDINVEGTTGAPPSVPVHDITIRNNIAYNVGGQQADNHGIFLVINGNSYTGANYTIDRNTCFNTYEWASITSSDGTTPFLTNFDCTNNIAFAGQYPIFGSVGGMNKAALDTYAPGSYTFAGNLVIGYTGTYALPTGNYIPASQDATGFTDAPGEDFQLLATSPYHNLATDGKDPGVDYTTFIKPNDFTPIDGTSTTPYLTNYYKFDEGSGTTVKNNAPGASGNATLTSALWSTSGEMNSAFAPTGGTSGSASASLTATNPFTFSVWINPSVVNVSQYIASTKNSGGASSFALSVNASGKVVATGTTGSITSSTALAAGNWYLITLVFDGTNFTLFQNGTQVGSVAGTTTTGATTLYIGGNQGSVSCFNGKIDEVRYYNTALNSQWAIGFQSNETGITQQQEIYKQFLPRVDFIEGNTNVTGTTTNRATWAISHDGSTVSYSFTNNTYTDLNHNPGSTTAVMTGANTYTPNLSFTAAGFYTLQLTVTDDKGMTTTVLDRTIKVIAAPQNLVLTPATATVQAGGTVAFSTSDTGIVDQFGNPWTFSEEPYAWVAVLTATGNGAYANGNISDSGVVGSTDSAVYKAKAASPGKGLVDTVYFTVNGIQVGTKSSVTFTSGATLPNAPSNLAVTSVGTSTIGLQWTDNSTNETGFHVYRSTDNATWGSPYATLGANVTTFTDTAPVSGTAYYYEVTAYNSAGDSSAAGMTRFAATVLASDEFNYSLATGWAGGNTGLGFASNWSISSSSHANIVSGLTYTSDDGHSLASTANALQITGAQTATGTLTSTLGTTGSTAWIGFEVNSFNTGTWPNASSEVDLGATSTNWLKMGFLTNARFGMTAQVSGTNTSYTNLTTTATLNTTYYLVYSIQYLSTGDIITMYVDPSPGSTTPSGYLVTGSMTLPASANLTTTNTIILRGNTSFDNPTYDELRIGKSFASVAPDPSDGIPAAPTNLAATVTQGITLTWTNNATDASGITIERSTDNSSWTPVGGVDASISTWTDTSTDDGTAYYYRISAYNDAGSSADDYTDAAVATVIASDEFNYTAESDFNNGNTGVGFAGGWSLAGTANISVISGGLSYSANGHALDTAGNAVQLGSGSTATQTLSNSVGIDGSTLWAGFEFSAYNTSTTQPISAEVDIGSSTNEVRLGAPFNGNIDADAVVAGVNNYLTGTTAVAANTTYFVAYSIQYQTTGDIINMYVNPTPGVVPTTASASLTLPATANLSPTATVVLKHSQSFSVATFDELRLGSSYMSVAPDPVVPNSTPTYPSITPSGSDFTLPSFSSNPTVFFSPVLSSLPVPTASIDLSVHLAPTDYHLGANVSEADPTLDSAVKLFDELAFN